MSVGTNDIEPHGPVVAAPSRGARILGGTDAEMGVVVDLTIVEPGRSAAHPSPDHDDVPSGGALAAAPLLCVVDIGEESFIVVGLSHVAMACDGKVSVTCVVHAAWSATRSGETAGPVTGAGARGWHRGISPERLGQVVEQALSRAPHTIPTEGVERVMLIAKGLSEQSRNAVASVQALRYQAESVLGDWLRRQEGYDAVLPDVVEIGIAASRARDLARQSVREGLWSHRNNALEGHYQAQRRLLDPTLPPIEDADSYSGSTMLRVLDGGVRQCANMVAALGEEISQCHRILSAGSTIAAARDAKAQETFNVLAVVGAAVLGLPSLVLAVYGVGKENVDFGRLGWLVPLLCCLMVSVGLTYRLTRSSVRDRLASAVWALGAGLVTLGLVVGAFMMMRH